MKMYTVIGYYDDTDGQIFCDHVEAETSLGAFLESATTRATATFVAAIPGHVHEGAGIEFPGYGVVTASTLEDEHGPI